MQDLLTPAQAQGSLVLPQFSQRCCANTECSQPNKPLCSPNPPFQEFSTTELQHGWSWEGPLRPPSPAPCLQRGRLQPLPGQLYQSSAPPGMEVLPQAGLELLHFSSWPLLLLLTLAPLSRVWHHPDTLERCIWMDGVFEWMDGSPLSLPFSRLTRPSSHSLSSPEMLQTPNHLCALPWTLSSSSWSSFSCGAQN